MGKGGLWAPSGYGNFVYRQNSIGTTRPAAALGTVVTPAQNSKGSYATAMLTASFDAYWIAVNFNSNFVTVKARNTICDIGVDPAGGTAYDILIPDLLASCATSLGSLSATAGQGIWYFFPLFIKAGSTVSCRASINNATVGTLRARCYLWGKPRDERVVRCGTICTAYGITAASSSGTAVTAGTISEGTWTSLGAITKRAWWWQCGFGVNDSTMTALSYFMDLGIGDGSNKQVVIENVKVDTSATEAAAWANPAVGCEWEAPASGATAYGRLQCSGTADSALSMAAYGVGG